MIFLRFNDESEYIPELLGDSDSVDVIGTISSGGVYDEAGEIVEPPKAIPGFHVNLIAEELPEGWEEFVIDRPTNPVRVFFGY